MGWTVTAVRPERIDLGGAGATGARVPALAGQNFEDLLSVLRQFGLADATDAGQPGQVGRLLAGDLPQRLVLEDHVRGHALLPGLAGPPLPQPLEDLGLLRAQILGHA